MNPANQPPKDAGQNEGLPTGPEAEEQQVAGRATQYVVLGEIGRGGVGVIFRSRDRDIGRDVAMKVLREDLADNESLQQRFIEEAQISGQLQHPGIVPVYDLGLNSDDRPYFTMKLIEGRTLDELLKQRQEPSEDRTRFLKIYEQICQTVAYAHSRKVIHRDLKPANVMVGAFGEVQVLDWGFAKVLGTPEVAAGEGSESPSPPNSEESTRASISTVRHGSGSSTAASIAGSVLGTPAYMPPEQARGKVDEVDTRADVFSLGAILCEILTGKPPYREGPVLLAAADADLADAWSRLQAAQVDPALEELCRDCLAADAELRPRDASLLAGRISGYLTSVEDRARQAQLAAVEARLRGRWLLTLVLAAVGLLAVGGGAYLFMQQQRRQRQERTLAAVNPLLAEALRLRGLAQGAAAEDLSHWQAALAKLDEAKGLLATGEHEPSLRNRLDQLQETLQRELTAARAAAELVARDQNMLAALAAGRGLTQHDSGGINTFLRELEQGFLQAFADYGIDLGQLEVDEACERIAESNIAVELASSLDQMVETRRYRGDSERAQFYLDIAQAADPDEQRNRVRDAARDRNAEELLALARSEQFAEFPSHTQWLLGNALSRVGHLPEALSVYKRGLHFHPDELRFYSTLSEMLVRIDPSQALQYARAYVALLPHNVRSHLTLARVLKAAGDHTEAAESFRDAVQLNPEDPRLWINLIQQLQLAGSRQEALEGSQAATRRHPDHAQLQHLLSVEWQAAGDLPQAIAAAEEAARLEPKSAARHSLLGTLYFLSGDATTAEDRLQSAIRLGSQSNDAYYLLGLLSVLKGEEEQAATHLRQAYRLDPSDSIPAALLVILLATTADARVYSPAEALRLAEWCRERYPEDYLARMAQGIALHYSDRLEEAKKAFEEAQAVRTGIIDHAVFEYYYATTLWELGEQEAAVQVLRRVDSEIGQSQENIPVLMQELFDQSTDFIPTELLERRE